MGCPWRRSPCGHGLAGVAIAVVLLAQSLQQSRVFGRGRMLLDVTSKVGARVRHEPVDDKRQRRRRALDVQEDGLHAGEPGTHGRPVEGGVRYDGPKHTG